MENVPERVKYYLLDFKDRCEWLPIEYDGVPLRKLTQQELLDLFDFAVEYDRKLITMGDE